MKLKALIEKRNALIDELAALSDKAIAETRAFTEDEQKEFSEKRAEIDSLGKTIDALQEERAAKIDNPEPKDATETRSEEEIFDDFIKGKELRANEMKASENGSIIPQKLSDDIIRKVTELSGIYNLVSKVSYPGTYKQIKEKDKVTAGWTAELAEVTVSKADFETVDIGHHKLGALAKISLELINQSQVPVVSEATNQMVDSFTEKLEEAIIKGSGSGQPQGLSASTNNILQLKSKEVVTADELIDAQSKLKTVFDRGAKWIMHPMTLAAIRKLKDKQDRYLFNDDLTKEYAGYLLGKPVLVTDVIDELKTANADKTVILYGDFGKAYKVNNHPNMFTQVLREAYISQGAIGVIGFLFADGKIVDEQAFVNVKSQA